MQSDKMMLIKRSIKNVALPLYLMAGSGAGGAKSVSTRLSHEDRPFGQSVSHSFADADVMHARTHAQ